MMRHTPQRRTQKYFSRECLVLIKYSNGGRSGVEPDFLKYRNDISLLSVQLFKPYLSLAIQFADEYTTFSRHCQQFSEICPRIRRGEFVPLNAALRRNSCAGEAFPIYSALPEQKLLLFPK